MNVLFVNQKNLLNDPNTESHVQFLEVRTSGALLHPNMDEHVESKNMGKNRPIFIQ